MDGQYSIAHLWGSGFGRWHLRAEAKKWGWALAGSIATLLLLIIIGTVIMMLDIPPYISYIVVLAGIAAIAFAILSKGVFK